MAGRSPARAVLYSGWEHSPDLVAPEVTHAVPAGTAVAVCGMTVGAQGGPWPAGYAPVPTASCFACTDNVARQQI